MLLNPLTLHTPQTALEAAKLYKELKDVKVLAGGTFLLNSMKLLKTKGMKTVANILSLAKVDELKKVSLNKGALTIGAMTTVNELFVSFLLKDNLAILRTVCRNISTNPIRNMATIGGNLTCRYTWTEMGTVMIALDAQMHFLKEDGKETTLDAEEFFKTGARAEHLFTHVTIKHEPKARMAYRRIKKSQSVDVPMLAVCLKTELKGKQWSNTRVGVNNCVAFAQRDASLEEFLNKSASSANLGAEALQHLTTAIYDTRASEYKQHVFRVSLRSAINELAQWE